jgi:hypothetical protein
MRGVFLKRLLLLLTAFIMIFSASVAFAEEDSDAVINEWEEKYGDQRLWDYQVNAAFAEQESWRYAWNPSMRPMLPDQDAISAEEAENLAIQLSVPKNCGQMTLAAQSQLLEEQRNHLGIPFSAVVFHLR